MPEVMSIEVDEEFDPRPPSSPFGLRGPDGNLNYGMIGGIAIAIVLVLMLIFVVVKPFSSEKPPVVATWKPKDPAAKVDFLDLWAPASPMATSIQNSLESWAKYYTTANLDDLSFTFDQSGNQYAQLVGSQSQIAAEKETGKPAIIELGHIGKVTRKDNVYTVRVVVNWTKPGAAEGKVYRWDIDMKEKGSIFVLNTVRETDANEKQPIDFCGAVAVVSNLDDIDTIGKELKKVDNVGQVAIWSDVLDAKIKAWKLLDLTVQGSDSEEAVSAILLDYETQKEAAKDATTLAQISESGSGVDLTDFENNINTRASQECGKDIANK